jgi:two-component system, NtrC family, response regulator
MVRVLVVDPENGLAAALRTAFPHDECRVTRAGSGLDALAFLKWEKVDVVILDTRIADMENVELLAKLKASYSHMQVIVIINPWHIDTAVMSMRLGAYDCVARPVQVDHLRSVVLSAHEVLMRRRGREIEEQRNDEDTAPDEFIGKSGLSRDVKKLISIAAPYNLPVLILGEIGTGKKLVARAVHRASNRSSGPFIMINPTGVENAALETELFGCREHDSGMGKPCQPGLVETANGGTIFVAELGDMSPAIQEKLLLTLDTGISRRLGDTREIQIDVRFISATSMDPDKEPARVALETDFFYKLNGLVIRIPPLRERKDDIPALVDYFLAKISRDGTIRSLTPQALALLMEYPWPGNVRELANALEWAILISKGDPRPEITSDKLPRRITETVPTMQIKGGLRR